MQIVHRHKGMAEFCGQSAKREEECTNTDAKISKNNSCIRILFVVKCLIVIR